MRLVPAKRPAIFDRKLISGCGLKSLLVVVFVVVVVVAATYPLFLNFFKSVPFRHISIYGEIISHFLGSEVPN